MPSAGTSFYLTQNNTASAPSASTDGQLVKDLDAITVVLEVANVASHTLAGAGNLRCYAYNYDGTAFTPNGWYRIPGADLAVPASASALLRISFLAVELPVPRAARMLYVPDGVTQNGGGTQVKVYQLGFSKLVRAQYG